MNMNRQHEMATQLVSEHLDRGMDRRDMLKKAAMLGVGVPALTAALGARGAFAQSASPAASASASPAADVAPTLGKWDGKKIKVSIALAENELQVYKNVVVAKFKELTGGDAEVVTIESADVVNTLKAQVGSGNVQIDLLDQDNNALAPLVDEKLVEEITDAESIMPGATIAALKDVCKFDGKYYFLPSHPNVELTYYNSTKLKDNGLEAPKTWDELTNVGKTLMEKEGVGKLCVQGVAGSAVGVTVCQFLWQAGGDPLTINNEAGQKAFEYMASLKQYLTPQYPTAKYDTINTYMLDESVYLMQNWPFGVNVIVKDGGKKEVLTYTGWEGPAGNALVLGGNVFGIAKGTPNKDMALDFIKVSQMKEVQEQLIAQIGWSPMRDDALGSVEDWQKPYFQTLTDALKVAKARPSVTYWGKVEEILTNAWNDIVTGGSPVKDTLDRYQGEIDKLKG